VLFEGGGDATPVGPAVQPAGKWTVSTAPAKITTTTTARWWRTPAWGPSAIAPPSAASGGMTPARRGATAGVYWDKTNGQNVLATNLVPPLANNSVVGLLGGGTYTHLCLSWLVTANNTYTLYYIKLSPGHPRLVEITSAELSTC